MTILAERLKLLRSKAGISQSQAGEIIGVQFQTYQKYEYGQAEPTHENLIAFALYYETSIDYLTGNTDKEKTKLQQVSQFTLRLKELRRKTKIYQKELAKEIGVSERTYRRYEAGDTCPNIDTLCKLAAFYGVSVDYLVGLDVAE